MTRVYRMDRPGSRLATIQVPGCVPCLVWNTVPGSLSSAAWAGYCGSQPAAQARSPSGVNRLSGTLTPGGSRTVPVQRTRCGCCPGLGSDGFIMVRMYHGNNGWSATAVGFTPAGWGVVMVRCSPSRLNASAPLTCNVEREWSKWWPHSSTSVGCGRSWVGCSTMTTEGGARQHRDRLACRTAGQSITPVARSEPGTVRWVDESLAVMKLASQLGLTRPRAVIPDSPVHTAQPERPGPAASRAASAALAAGQSSSTIAYCTVSRQLPSERMRCLRSTP